MVYRFGQSFGAVIAVAMMLAMPGVSTAMSEPGNVKPSLKGELIFPLSNKHNHGSCVVEMPDGGLFAVWYRGSGERHADDVAVMGSRLKKGSNVWEKEFVVSDTPGFPDTNPCIWVDPKKRLWLFHSTILDNEWESAITRVKVSSTYQKQGTIPVWQLSDLVLLKPGPEFPAAVDKDLEAVWAPVANAMPGRADQMRKLLDVQKAKAHNKLAVRLGWMTRAHPTLITTRAGVKRLLLPLYSDGFDFSLVAYTDDEGATWSCSAPIIGQSNVQPSILQRKDKTLIAYFRDNGPPPQRIMQSESTDDGVTWTLAHDIVLPDPGAGVEGLILKSGRWVVINNDTENGRHSLAVSVSEDEGRTWLYKKHLERAEDKPGYGTFAYPSIIQAHDGLIHATYTFTPGKSGSPGESIKHAVFNEAWLLSPEGREPIK